MNAEAEPTLPGRWSRFWLASLFTVASKAPWILRAIKPVGVFGAVAFCKPVRRAAAANGSHIFGHALSPREARRFARRVIGEFYEFVLDVARCRGATLEQLHDRIDTVTGYDDYLEARAANRHGAVLVTAHMGSFEVGLAGLRSVEANIRVVFKRDPFPAFESIRAAARQTLGVHEAAIDDGWATLLSLRQTLSENGVVVMQADRAMPGQRAEIVPMFGAQLAIPAGPITLARLAGCPIIPVFTVRETSGKFHVHLLDPIDAEDAAAPRKIAVAIESFVARYPHQWLVLEPAFIAEGGWAVGGRGWESRLRSSTTHYPLPTTPLVGDGGCRCLSPPTSSSPASASRRASASTPKPTGVASNAASAASAPCPRSKPRSPPAKTAARRPTFPPTSRPTSRAKSATCDGSSTRRSAMRDSILHVKSMNSIRLHRARPLPV